MRLFYAAEQRRLNEARAATVEDVATGYSSCRSKKGARAAAKFIDALRNG